MLVASMFGMNFEQMQSAASGPVAPTATRSALMDILFSQP